jgi:hypothetical protein
MPRKIKSEKVEVKAVTETAKAPVKKKTTVHKPRAVMAATPAPMFNVIEHHAEIAQQAYFYWLERGCGHGNSTEDWTRAEKAMLRQWEAQQKA